jgi:hypothetical protein
MFMVRRETGALESARPFVQAARADGTWEPGLLALYTVLGFTDAAQRLLHRLVARLDPASGRQAPWAQWTAVLVFLAEAAVALRDRAAAGPGSPSYPASRHESELPGNLRDRLPGLPDQPDRPFPEIPVDFPA